MPDVALPAVAATAAAAPGRMSLAVLRALAELLALLRISAPLCSLNPSLLCCDDVDSLEIG